MFTVVVVPCTLFLRFSSYMPFGKLYVQEVFYHSPKDMCQIFTVFLLIFIAEVSPTKKMTNASLLQFILNARAIFDAWSQPRRN